MPAVELLKTTLAAILPLFGLVLVGYLGKKTRVLLESDAGVLSRFVVNIALPAFIIDAFLNNHVRTEYFKLPIVLWVAAALAFALGVLANGALKGEKRSAGATAMSSAFGNTGYLGYPLTTALLPGLLPAAVICDQLGMALLLYPGVVIVASVFGRASGEPISKSFLRYARSPLFLAMIAGAVIALVRSRAMSGPELRAIDELAPLGQALASILHGLAEATIPVILVAIGLLLRTSTLASHWKAVTIIGVIKLLIMPLAGWALARYGLGLHGKTLTVCVLELAVPPSAAATVFAGEYDMDGPLAVAAFFALTVASAVTIPVMLTLLR